MAELSALLLQPVSAGCQRSDEQQDGAEDGGGSSAGNGVDEDDDAGGDGMDTAAHSGASRPRGGALAGPGPPPRGGGGKGRARAAAKAPQPLPQPPASPAPTPKKPRFDFEQVLEDLVVLTFLVGWGWGGGGWDCGGLLRYRGAVRVYFSMRQAGRCTASWSRCGPVPTRHSAHAARRHARPRSIICRHTLQCGVDKQWLRRQPLPTCTRCSAT